MPEDAVTTAIVTTVPNRWIDHENASPKTTAHAKNTMFTGSLTARRPITTAIAMPTNDHQSQLVAGSGHEGTPTPRTITAPS